MLQFSTVFLLSVFLGTVVLCLFLLVKSLQDRIPVKIKSKCKKVKRSNKEYFIRKFAITNVLEERLLSEHVEPQLSRVRELLLARVSAGDHMCRLARHALRDRGDEPLEELPAHVAIDGLEDAGQHDAQARQAVRAALSAEKTLNHISMYSCTLHCTVRYNHLSISSNHILVHELVRESFLLRYFNSRP